MAVPVGSIPLLLGLALGLWSIRRFDGRSRIYFATRGSLYLFLGLGLIAGHWKPLIGVAAVVFFIAGQVGLGLARRRILGTSSAGA